MQRRILVIIPFLVDESTRESHLRCLQRDAGPRGSVLSAVSLSQGPTPADFSEPGFNHAVSDIVAIAQRHQDDFDGIMISCFEDPGLAEVREVAHIPVVAPCESALQLARSAGGRFFIVSPDPGSEPLYRQFAAGMGLAGCFGSFVHVPFEIEAAGTNADLPDVVAEAIRMTRQEGAADLAILGCTAFTECYEGIVAGAGGRILDPARASIKLLELLIDLGLRRLPDSTRMERK
ncbi:MAG: hypothetical protein JSR66_08580 [Proteobacteria bacterium]|nr:hypothetical protein [Pseudomonadota bacterium]